MPLVIIRSAKRAVAFVEHSPVLDLAAGALCAATDRVIPEGPIRKTLQGAQLGHPLHPMLTDIPIGMLTSASVLDLAGPRTGTAARRFVGLGLLSAVPTIAAGLADWSALTDKEAKRVGVVHASANLVGLACYLSSYRARRRGSWVKGVAMSVLGMTSMTVGGYLGGHLAFPEVAPDPTTSTDVTAPSRTEPSSASFDLRQPLAVTMGDR